MKKLIYCFCIIALIILNTPVVAVTLTCPLPEIIKSVTFYEALQNKYDPEMWDFNSKFFYHESKKWYVTFGTFLPNAKNEIEALSQGQAYFNQAPLAIPYPEAIILPQYIVCEYMPTGRLYWVVALGFPGQQDTTVRLIGIKKSSA